MGQWGSGGSLWGGGIAESLYPGYDVILGGVGLLLEKNGYERRVGQAYAAKLSTAGTTQNDRLRDELLLLDNWNGGEGYLRFEPDTPDRYRRGSGIDPYTEEGAVALGPYMGLEWGSALNGLTKLGSGNGELFIGTSAGLIYTHSGSGTPSLDYTTGKAGGIKSFLRAYGDVMYAGTGTDGLTYADNNRPIMGAEVIGIDGKPVEVERDDVGLIAGRARGLALPGRDRGAGRQEDLERAGGVTADDRVEVQPWLAAERRFSFVSSDPRAIDLACFASLKR